MATATKAPVKPATRSAPRMDWTGNKEADRLVGENPLALLIGFCLDQQVPVEWAFMGPLRVRERLGTLDAKRLARMDPSKVETAFRTPPALHRYPGSMAQRVQGLCAVVAEQYGGDASRIWREAADARELQRRFAALPGFGPMKARIMVGVVAKQLGVKPAGWKEIAPEWPTLADVHTVKEREDYQAQKRAFKASLRAQQEPGDPPAKRARR
ncbi:MAG: Fe-S cluster assembly protein HesB [Candidatus Dormibacteraeota bacterium]|nr:Fe-S cluster assembly protein HesB [Candidatus Dormibacteraeota bacterium]MBV9524750.1 Fe-S cluster assembly protein HesB [Candidatus Dormibacteraeota bacterium]